MQKKISLFVLLIISAALFIAATPQFKTYFAPEQLEKGKANGVAIDGLGQLKLAPALEEAYRATVPYFWCATVDAQGAIYAGGGNPALVVRLNGKRGIDTLYKSEEVAVFALAQASGNLYFATAPQGQVYQLDKAGKVKPLFKPETKYIWALETLKDGSLLVATGEPARIFVVSPAGQARTLFESEEAHIRALCWDERSGWLYAGSSGNGYLYRLKLDGAVEVLFDAPMDEIHRIALQQNNVYIAAASAGFFMPGLALPGAAPHAAEMPPAEEEDDAIVISAEEEASGPEEEQITPPANTSGGVGAIYKITAPGLARLVWNSRNERVHAFTLTSGASSEKVTLLLGTGDQGKVYRVEADDTATLLLQSEPSQITSLTPTSSGQIIMTTANPGTVKILSATERTSGEYESEALDANVPAQWGALNWEAKGSAQFFTRSGNTGKPDKTWSAWAAVPTTSNSGVIASPAARFVQWKVKLEGAGVLVKRVQLSYIQKNVAPEIVQIKVYEPNEAFPEAKNNAAHHANGGEEGMEVFPNQPAPAGGKVTQKGAQSLGWIARDDNNDALEFRVEIRAVGEDAWRELAKEYRGQVYTLDSQALPDGEYHSRVSVSDRLSNPASLALQAEKTSELFVIDNSAPEITPVRFKNENQKIVAEFEAKDQYSRLKETRYALSAGAWELLYPEDGVADQKSESYRLTLPASSRNQVLAIKAVDVNGNIGFRKIKVTQ
ncbi:MAG: hypothetical protein AAB354_11225 [candidate division KSB1 bacterium]